MPAAACALACAPTATPKLWKRFSGNCTCRLASASAKALPRTVAATNCASPASACASAEMPMVTLTPRLNSAWAVKSRAVRALAEAQSFLAAAPAPSRGWLRLIPGIAPRIYHPGA